MNRPVATVLTLLALLALIPTSLAHSGALVISSPTGDRCYVYSTHSSVEYWVETNGVATGGVPEGSGLTNHQLQELGFPEPAGSGLQRFAEHGVPADTKLTEAAWLQRCAA